MKIEGSNRVEVVFVFLQTIMLSKMFGIALGN